MAGRSGHPGMSVARILRLLQRRRCLGDARTRSDWSMVAVGAKNRRLRSTSGRGSPAAVGLRDRCSQRRSTSHRRRQWTQRGDCREDLLEQRTRHHHLRHLEGDRSTVPDDLRADLDQPVPQRGQRPMLDLLGQRQGAPTTSSPRQRGARPPLVPPCR